MQIAILGRQPKLSIAELEAIFGAKSVTELTHSTAALIDTDKPLPQARLGGTVKSAKLLTRLEQTGLEGAFAYLQKLIPELLVYLPEGKLQLGVSIYGLRAQKNWLLRQMLELKKIVKKQGRGIRIIENKSEALEAAQVLYNKLTGPLGWELLLIKDGDDILIAQTTGVQNIDDYSKRDFDRPKRDAYVGMLPPKLAQIMINLAVGEQSLDEANLKIQDPRSKISILDPFCGTGVVLQEALLMGYNAYGSDLSEKMVAYSTQNIDWILNQVQNSKPSVHIEKADATNHRWDFSKLQDLSSGIYVVCETYLGKPLTSLPDKHALAPIMDEANQIAEGFLKNIAPQLKSGMRLVVALPAWHLGKGMFWHLKMLDHLSDLGYNRLDLVHASKQDLIYHRENQVVARELTILVRS